MVLPTFYVENFTYIYGLVITALAIAYPAAKAIKMFFRG